MFRNHVKRIASISTGLAFLALSGCGPDSKPASPSAPSAAPAGAVVGGWGPQGTQTGVGVNVQPDGASALWIKIAGVVADPKTNVTFGGIPGFGLAVRDDLVTVGIPNEVIAKAGTYEVIVNEPSRKTVVGNFVVKDK